MRTGSELLGRERDALVPLSATLVGRPVRVCVFVPLYPEVPWEASVEHAIACQARYWGGHASLVVPMFDGLAADEVFWRLVRQYDPDLIGLHAPTLEDVGEIAPALHEEAISRIRSSLARDGFDQVSIDEYMEKARSELFWDVDLPDELAELLIRWVAPLHHRTDPRTILVNGSNSVPDELIDVLKLTSLPPRFENPRVVTNPLDQLLLTGSIGRLTGSTARALGERGVAVEERELKSIGQVVAALWPRDRSAVPLALPETALARRAGAGRVDVPVVVVGDHPRDWLLYWGLHTLRPLVYWFPVSRFAEGLLVDRLRHELQRAARTAGGDRPVAAVSASSGDAAEHAAAELLAAAHGRRARQAELRDWRDYVPVASFSPADARSIRTTALLRSAGTTDQLPTPTPAAFSPQDLLSSGWVVDVEVRDWSTFRHRALGEKVLPGSFASTYDQRLGAGGACYLGLAAFVQTGLGLENALSRRQLAPLPILDALSEALSAAGWTVTLSDKGAYTQRSAQLLGGVEQLVQALRGKSTRRLLNTYMSDRRADAPGRFLPDTRRRYLSLQEAAEVLGDGAEDIVNSLYDRGALSRGHALKCEQCRATSFYSLTEHQRFVCRRCRHEQRATRASWLGDAEPVFRYELAEVIYQFLDHDGDIPLLAAYDYFVSKLGARDRRPLDLGFELEIFSPEGKKSEHDIAAVWGCDLWLGEATKKQNLEPKEVGRLRRLKEVADVLAARGVLFATTGEFSVRTRARVDSIFAGWPRPEIDFLEHLPT